MKKSVKKSTSNICRCYYQYIDIYNSHIIFYYGSRDKCVSTISKFLSHKDKKVKKEMVDDLKRYIGSPENTTDYFCTDYKIDSEQWILVCAGNSYDINDPIQLSSISHECLHATIFIARHKEFYEDEGHSEPITYLHDFIYQFFLEKIKKSIQKDNNHDNKIHRTRTESGNSQHN